MKGTMATSGQPNEEEGNADKHESQPLLGGSSDVKKQDLTCGLAQWLENLSNAVGYKILTLLFFVEHLLRGFVSEFAGQALPYLMKTYHIPAPTLQIYSSVSSLPWAMKPIIGLVSDLFPINGYRKGPYMAGASVIGALSFIAIGTIPRASLPVLGVVGCGFLIQNQLATNDILVEAKYAEKIQENPHIGSSVLTFVWFGMSAMGLVGTAFSGFTIHSLGPKACFLICSIPATLAIAPVMMGYLEENKISADELAETRAKFYKQREACLLCVLMLGAILILMVTALVSTSPIYNASVAGVVFVVMLVAFSIVLSPTIAMFNAFSLIQTSFSLSTGAAGFYFMTDTPEQYPEGPHFSEIFFTTVLGTVGAVISLIGIVSYERYMSSCRYRNLLVITNIAISCLSCVDVVFYMRLNVKWGIPDHMFVLSSSVLSGVIGQWQWMPQVIILSYLCPKGMEATMYALLAGCHNLGNNISSCFGALLLHHLGVTPSGSAGESDKFENLWIASLIASVLPIISIVALFRLIPDVKQGDSVVDPSAGATSGSLLRRWLGKADTASDDL